MSTKEQPVKKLPPQEQSHQPGVESKMKPQPVSEPIQEKSAGRVKNKVALITGGDSGIGKAVALSLAKEGADIIIVYLEEEEDAQKTANEIIETGRSVMLCPGDITDESFCKDVVKRVIKNFKKIDILINNAAVQYPVENFEEITKEQLVKTFSVNVFSAFYFTLAALPHMKKGSVIINTTSVTAYRGSHHLVDYSATKGALVSFTRSLSSALAKKGIRVNAVAPGPIWTPLIPSSFDKKQVGKFGQDTPMGRPGQPNEVASCFLFLASEESSYITGQVLHPNGGEIING